MPVPEGFIIDSPVVPPFALPEGFVLDTEAKMQPAHTPGADLLTPKRDPQTERQVMGVSPPNAKVFKTPAETKQAALDLADTAATIGTVPYNMGVQAVSGISGILGGGEDAVRGVQEALSYQPQTESGVQAAKTISYPFEKLAQGAEYLGDKTLEATGSPLAATAVDTAINAIPFLAPFIKKGYTAGKAAIENSDWYRMATNEERGLVVQTFDDAVRNGASEADLARMNPEYFREALKRRATAEGTTRPTHDNLAEGIPAAESLNLQKAAPEVKPVVKGTKAEILDLKKQGSTEGKVIYTAGDTAYVIDPAAVQGIYGGSVPESLRKAKLDLKAGGDAESTLLGYPARNGLTPDQTIDTAVTKTGEVVTDLPTMKAEKEAGNIAWAAEGRPEEVIAKAQGVSNAIRQEIPPATREVMPSGEKTSSNAQGNAPERYAQGREEGVLSDLQQGEAPQVTGGQPSGRRMDNVRRQEIQSLIDSGDVEGAHKLIYEDPLTGLLNKRAWDATEAQSGGKTVALMDLSGLKYANDTFGYDAGDSILKAMAGTLKESGVEAYRKGGDEITAVFDNPALANELLQKAQAAFADKIIEVRTPDGQIQQYKGWRFDYGTGKGFTEADASLKTRRAELTTAGQRAERGARPMGVVETIPEGFKIDDPVNPPAAVKSSIERGNTGEAQSPVAGRPADGFADSAGTPGRAPVGILTDQPPPEVAPRFEQTAAGMQGKMFATPPTFGRKPQKVGEAVSTSALTDNFTSEDAVQGNMFGGKGFADTGGYDLSRKSAIELPEIVEISKDLMDGKLPHVMRKLSHSRALAQFFPRGAGEIKLKADIFKEPGLAERVLAHEVGHLSDYLSDRDMGRGNILGRIGSLKKYLKQSLEEYEGAPGALTGKDRARIRTQAAQELKANERPEQEIIEEITREIPKYKYLGITPEMVKGIWNDVNSRGTYPKLYEAIARMNAAEKVNVMKEALKGLVAEQLKKFGERVQVGVETVTEKVKRVIPAVEASPEQIAKRYRELIEEEIKKRSLYTRDQITQELKDLTLHWKPFTPGANQFSRYRFSSPELYADALSVLINDPPLLRQIAPTFEKAFFSYLHRKPEVRDVYYEVQQRLHDPAAVQARRLDDIFEMSDAGDVKRQEMNKRLMDEGEKVVDTAMRTLVDERWAAKKVIGGIRKLGHTDLADTALQKIEDIPYLASEVNQVLSDLNGKVLEPMAVAGVELKELSAYLFAKRIIGEEFKPVVQEDGSVVEALNTKAAAKGHTPDTARAVLNELAKRAGPEKYAAIEQAAGAFLDFREQDLIPEFERSGYFTPAEIKLMKENRDYVRFNVQRFLDEDPAGLGGFAAKIHARQGSLEDIENPFIATLLQDLSFLRAARINESKQAFKSLLVAGGPDFIQPAATRFSQDLKGQIPVPPKDRDMDIFKVKENGKWTYHYMDKELVEAFDHQPVIATQMAKFWAGVTQPFKELFVSKNPAWLLRNIPRDFQRTMANVGQVRLRDGFSITKSYYSTFKDVWRFTHEGARSPQIERMMKEKSIPAKRTWESKDSDFDNEIERMLVNYGLSAESNKGSGKLVQIGKNVWRWMDNTAAASDIWGKVAADKWMNENSTYTQAQRVTAVRNMVGTPNFKNKGTLNPITNSLFMFSNVGVQGLRSGYQAYKANSGRYLWKMFNMNILPKLVLWAAGTGLLGAYYKKVLDKVPDYDKRIYHIVPLLLDANRRAHYLRIPADYEGQFIGASVWNLMHGKLMGKDAATGTLSAATPYTLHPALQVGSVLGSYFLGGNVPNDSFTGMPVMTDDQRKAGGTYAAKALGKHSWNKVLSNIYRLDPDTIQADQTLVEKTLKTFPLNALGSFYRISDKGDDERIREALSKVQQNAAIARIESGKALRNFVQGKELTQDEIAALAVHPGDLAGKAIKMITKKHGMKYANALLNAQTPEEKMAIIQLMQENSTRPQ